MGGVSECKVSTADYQFPWRKEAGRYKAAGDQAGQWNEIRRSRHQAARSQAGNVSVWEIKISARVLAISDRMAAGSRAALLPEPVFSHSLRLHNRFFSLKSRTIMRER